MKTKSPSTIISPETFTPRFVALSLLAVLLLALTGCKHQTTAAINPVGVYTLVSVNGKNVPCSAWINGNNHQIRSLHNQR